MVDLLFHTDGVKTPSLEIRNGIGLPSVRAGDFLPSSAGGDHDRGQGTTSTNTGRKKTT